MWPTLHPHSYAGKWWIEMRIRSKMGLTKDRAEAVLSTPSPALSEALIAPGVQHLMNLTIPLVHVKFDSGCFRLEAA